MLIVVTGFGVFRGYDVNPSWEAVKALPAAWDDEQHEVVVEEIPVQYDFVLKEVPERWSSRQPDFIIHVGVSHLAEKLTLLVARDIVEEVQRGGVDPALVHLGVRGVEHSRIFWSWTYLVTGGDLTPHQARHQAEEHQGNITESRHLQHFLAGDRTETDT